MDLQSIKELLKRHIPKQLNIPFSSVELTPVGGGSINDTYRLTLKGGEKFFLKLNAASNFPDLFQKEKSALEFLARQNCIAIPSVFFSEKNENYQLLLLEWIESGSRTDAFWKKFGEQLAMLHHTNNDRFGFREDNYMGALSQNNAFTDNWTDFFIHSRLIPQIRLALENTRLESSHAAHFEIVFKKLDSIFDRDKPSLLHGDLWSGNYMCNKRSLPVLIDPAVYFGHRSMDLAMTTLFGGFDKIFYDSYDHYFPLPANYSEQWEICNLYPLLIHLNLFGKSYLQDITSILNRFV